MTPGGPEGIGHTTRPSVGADVSAHPTAVDDDLGKMRSGRVGLAVRLVGDAAGTRANGHEFGAREATGGAVGGQAGAMAR